MGAIRFSHALAALGLAAGVMAGDAAAQQAQPSVPDTTGYPGYGYGYGPGMMGPGMMGPGYGPGMGYGPGPGMGYGMPRGYGPMGSAAPAAQQLYRQQVILSHIGQRLGQIEQELQARGQELDPNVLQSVRNARQATQRAMQSLQSAIQNQAQEFSAMEKPPQSGAQGPWPQQQPPMQQPSQ